MSGSKHPSIVERANEAMREAAKSREERSSALRVAWGHAMALLKALRGKPEEGQAKGLVKALEKMRGETARTS
jgi:hypothetical protein